MADHNTDGQTKAQSSVIVDLTTYFVDAPRSTASSQLENFDSSPQSWASTMQTPKLALDNEQRHGLISHVSGRKIRAPDRLGGGPNEFLDSEDDGPRRSLSNRGRSRGSSKKGEPEETLEEAKKRCDEYAESYDKLKVVNKEMHKEFVEFKHKKAKLNKDYKAEKARKIALQKELKQRDADIDMLQMQLRAQKVEYEQKLTKEQENFFEAQEAVSELMKKGATHTISDDVVRNELQKLKSTWRPWSKEWAAPSLDGLDLATIQVFVNYGCLNANPTEVRERCRAILNIASAPSILLNLMLAQLVCKKLFQHPFVFFTQKTSDGSSIRAAFEAVLEEKEHTHLAKACAWRAHTLQMLSPFVHVEPGTDEARVQQSLIKALNHKYGSIARSLERIFAPLLKNVTEEQAIKRYGELVAICSKAGNLAYNLWSQKTRMDCVRVFGSDTVFHIKSTIMQPHASMLCDHDSHEYDGRLVQLCVEPALIAFGNEQGQDYDKYKIWMPATVWIAEDVPKSIAGKSDERVDVPIKQEVDSDEDSVNAPRRKRVRFGQAAPPAEASKVGTSSNLKDPSGERSVNLNATSSSTPPSSKRKNEGNRNSTNKNSARDAAPPTNAFDNMESAKNDQGPAGLQKGINSENSKPRPPTQGVNSRGQNSTQSLRAVMADEADNEGMSTFKQMLAQASRPETTYERGLMANGPSAGQLRPSKMAASTGRDQEVNELSEGINDDPIDPTQDSTAT